MRMLMLVLLVACGGKGPGGGSGGHTYPEPEDAEEKGGGTDAPLSQYAMVVVAASDAPDCTDKNPSQLIYVETLEEFQYCKAGEWVQIDIQGPAGKDGKNGVDGLAGEDGIAPSANVWKDPATGWVWQMFATTQFGNYTCAEGWVKPKYWFVEMEPAVERGMWTTLQDQVGGTMPRSGAWLFDGTEYFTVIADPTSASYGSENGPYDPVTAGEWTAFCIKKPTQ